MATETTRTRAPKPVSEWTAKDSATFFLNAYVVFSNPDDALALGDTIQFGVGTRRQLRAFFTALTERASPRCPVLSKAEGQAIVLKVAELAAKKHGVANYRDLYKPVGNGEADAHIRNGRSSCVWFDLDPKLEHAAGAQLLALLKLVPRFASRDTIALTKADLELLMAKGEELMSAAESKAKKRARTANADGAGDDAAGRIAELEARVAQLETDLQAATALASENAATPSYNAFTEGETLHVQLLAGKNTKFRTAQDKTGTLLTIEIKRDSMDDTHQYARQWIGGSDRVVVDLKTALATSAEHPWSGRLISGAHASGPLHQETGLKTLSFKLESQATVDTSFTDWL